MLNNEFQIKHDQFRSDENLQMLYRNKAKMLELAIPVGYKIGYGFIYDDLTNKILDYIDKLIEDYIEKNYEI